MKHIPYGRQYIDQQDIKAVVKVLKGDWITQGPEIGKFEEAFARYCGAKYAVAVTSGTAALHLACLAAGLKSGDEAITSPITFVATPNAVIYAGGRPVFADIDYDSVNIDTERIEKTITQKTKLILPVHFAGLPCAMEKIYGLAKRNGLFVIEDACHALGAEYRVGNNWIKVGSCCHSGMAVFSFHPVKHITTGEGGAITTNDKRLYERLKALRNHGIYRDKGAAREKPWYYEMRELGFNYRITDFQCALGMSQLRKVARFLKRRREIAGIYKKGLSGIDSIDLPIEKKDAKSAWHLYVIKLKNGIKPEVRRKRLFNYLRHHDIGAQVHYRPVYFQPYYMERPGFGHEQCPVAEDYYGRAISLPIYYGMSDRDVVYAINILKKFL
ncbi:MAG: UDP-4-amino-4,6-dideoxy-N-acetyl-beta-L-altrosamine transaminase [Candidatus Omnitrophica bacterium]|nr:UDP-4-amino-4,6-dideoxy-N-acetyl-beta-L-altrosamine transaminase [Candidatus Omnitrophota bacterium]